MNKIIKIARQFAEDLGVDISDIQVAKIQDKIIFSSGDNLRIITAISKEQVITQLKNKFKDAPEQVEQILSADPHPDKAYSTWIGKLLLSKNIILPEDTPKILEKINLFNDLKKRNKIKGVDINRLKTYQELAKVVEEASGTKTQGESYRENLETGQELMFQDGQFKIVKVTTIEASSKLFRGTEWCVKDPEYSKGYLEQGPFVLVYKNDSPYALLHEKSGSAMDVYDKSIDEQIARDLASVAEHLGIRDFRKDLEIVLENVQGPKMLEHLDIFDEAAIERGYINIDKYIKINKGRKSDKIAWRLMNLAYEKGERLPEKYEKYIIQEPRYSVFYAGETIRGRWPEAEPIIAESAEYSVVYAKDIIKGRFPAGEAVIAKDACSAYGYAGDVIKGRFPAGEAVIAKNDIYSLKYAKKVIKGRFPAGEAVIAESSYDSYIYAKEVVKGRFPAGEPEIVKNINMVFGYAKDVVGGRWPEGEVAIISATMPNPSIAYDYARNIIKGRWPEAEPIILKSELHKMLYDKLLESLQDNNKIASVYSKIITAASKEQVITQLKNKFKDAPEQVEQILSADPHPDKAYSTWIGKLLLSKNIILPEDASKILEKINLFNDLKKRNKITGVDINRLKTYQELASIVEEASGTKTQGESYRENLDAGQELMYEDGEFKIVRVTTVEASSKLFRGTEWCVKDPEYSEDYIKQGPFVLVYKYDEPYVLLHEATGSAKDVYDESIDGYIGEELARIVEHLGIDTFNDDLEIIMKSLSDEKALENLDSFSDVALERGLISLDEYISVISRINPMDLPMKLYHVAFNSGSELPKEYEKYILSSAYYSYYYANEIINGRWPEAEAIIATDAERAHYYAQNIIKGPWPMGEAAIAKDYTYSCFYAINILKSRFAAGEDIISKSPQDAKNYAYNIIKGPWPEGEEAISKDAYASYSYAKDIIGGRWPMGEPAIMENKAYADLYKKFINEVNE